MTASIPAWPDPVSLTGQTFFTNAKAIFSAWKSKGLANPAALAMLAQAEAESSFDPNAMGDPDAKGDATAYGLHQWHASRLAAIKAATEIDVMADARAGKGTIPSQVDAAWWELMNLPWVGLKAIQSQSTAYGAACQACALFERVGAADAAQRRGAMAERWGVYFSKR